jgi:hypothetical protein
MSIEIGEINVSFPDQNRFTTAFSDELVRQFILAELANVVETVKNGKIDITDFGDYTRLFFGEYRINAWGVGVFRQDDDECGDECYDPECRNDHD